MKPKHKRIKGVVFSNLEWREDIKERMQQDNLDTPKWFANGIISAGYEFRCEKNPAINLLMSLWKGKKITLLCFNPSLIYLILFILPLPVKRVSLFQWRPLGKSSFIKVILIKLLLLRSDKIVVYSYIAKRYLNRYFKSKQVEQIGLFVDTDYFVPKISHSNNKKFILVPGDHKRNETLLNSIAKKLNIHIIRVTRDNNVRNAVIDLNSESITVKYKIDFIELKKLYQDCSAVLIISDSKEIPTGITTLSEAISSGAPTVITRGQSCSWPQEIAKQFPFIIISPAADTDAISAEIDKAMSMNRDEYRLSCDVFKNLYLSEKALSFKWSKILN